MHIGISSKSFKTLHQLHLVKKIPLSKMVLASGGPHSMIRDSYSGSAFIDTQFLKSKTPSESRLKKNRNEPCTLVQHIEILSKLHGVPESEMASALYSNS